MNRNRFKSGKRAPDFIIIGAMKSATSTLYEQLCLQEGIFMSEPKEPNFFSDDDRYAQGMGWYENLFSGCRDGDLCGEASTHYTKLPRYPHTVERLLQSGIRPKLVYVMRHPIDRLISHYIHEWSEGVIREDIERAIRKYPELVDYGRYAMQVEPYLEAFGEENVLPVFFDSIRENPQAELTRICRFIGYSGTPLWDGTRKPSNTSSERYRKMPFHELLIESELATRLRRGLVPKAFRTWVKDRLRMRKRPSLSKPLQDELKEIFDEDLRRLGKMLAVEISCDNFRSLTASRYFEFRSL